MKKYNCIKLFIIISLFILLQLNIKADTIEDFNISMDVKEDGKILVDQTLTYHFNNESHGIYATIPQFYTMNWTLEDNTNITKYYYFPITNVKVENEKYVVENSFEDIKIKIGDKNSYASNPTTYHYQYIINTKDLRLDNKQLFYINLVGNKWNAYIYNVNFTIKMPKPFSNQPIFYYQQDNVNDISNLEIEDNIISGSFDNNEKGLYQEGYTVYLNLDNNYFNYQNNHIDIISIIWISSFIIILLIVFVLFIKFGKDNKPVRVINFYPPDNMSSAQVAYVYKGSIDLNDVSSLFVYWASKGYVSIEEIQKEHLKVTKVNDISEKENDLEIKLFNSLFNKDNIFVTNEIKMDKWHSMNSLNTNYKHYYFNRDKAIFESKSSIIKYSLLVLVTIIFSIFISTILYFNIHSIEYAILAGVIFLIINTGIGLSIVLGITLYPKIRKKFLLIFICSIILIIFSIFYFILLMLLNILVTIPLLVSFILYLIMILINVIDSFMDKRTKYGTKELGEVLGFKEFLEKAEKPRLEALIKDDPTYFYNILPYAYVLEVSDIWIKKFENIKLINPNWYIGNDIFCPYIFMHNLNYSMNNYHSSALNNSLKGVAGVGGAILGSGGSGFGGGGFGGGGGGSW